jgi:uncharacterized protein (DUF1919 family)
VTQLSKFVHLYSCNDITLKMAVIAAETCGENIVNKIHHKYQSAFVGYLYILDLIHLWKMEHIKIHL